jgi:hypothetical protein
MKTVNEILASMDEERRVVRNQLDTYETVLDEERRLVRNQLDTYETVLDEERRLVRNQLDTYETELIARANALAAADDRIRHLLTESPDEL